jgi:hypothetical protein
LIESIASLLLGFAQSRFQSFVDHPKIFELGLQGPVLGVIFIDSIFKQSNLTRHVFDIELVVGSLMASASNQRKNRQASQQRSASDRE